MEPVAISQTDIDNLDSSIVSAEEEVQDGRRRVKKRSVDEQIKARQFAQSLVNQAAGTPRARRLKVCQVD